MKQMEFEIYYEDKFNDSDELSTQSKFMIKEAAPGGGFNETTFDNGLDMVNYIDKEKLLSDDEIPFPAITACIYELTRRFIPTNIGV